MEDALLGEKTIAFSIAQEILTTNKSIPAFPANGKKILAVVRQPKDEIDIPGFVKLIESDPGMFVRILGLANSSFYSEMEKIVSLRAAITRIGLIDIVNTVCLYFFQKLLPKFPDIPGFSYNDFWSHSWAVAVANRRLGHPNLEMGVLPGELYMAGMLQGIGKLLLAIHFPKDFAACVKQARELEQPLEKAEKNIFGTTDCLIASKVLTSWDFPPNICNAIAFCQMPEFSPPEHIIIAGLTQFAYSIVEQSGVGQSGDGRKMALAETCFGQKPNLKIAQPKIQEQLIKEINLSIKGKAEKITQIHSKQSTRPIKNQSIPRKKTASKTNPIVPEKKGVLGWVRSLWN